MHPSPKRRPFSASATGQGRQLSKKALALPLEAAPVTRGRLAPSTPVTPRDVPRAHLLLPAHGARNDAARARCGGRRLAQTLQRPSSAPSLDAPKTPRALRGSVRKASKVCIAYPPQGELCLDLARASSLCSRRRASARPSSAPCGPRARRVSFVAESTRDAADVSEAARRRSKLLLQSLHSLRRVSVDEAEARDEGEGMLMASVLAETEDSSRDIRAKQRSLEEAQDPIQELGGARHATTVIWNRTRCVLERKATLLEELEQRVLALEQAKERREELRQLVLTSDPGQRALPPETLQVQRFLKLRLHPGNPADADKSRFEHFASTFGLPARHQVVLRASRLLQETCDWWAEQALAEAEVGSATSAITRLVEAAAAIAGSEEHPALQRCREVLGDRAAVEALERATQLFQRDAATSQRSERAQPESARTTAEAIKQEIKEGVARGAPPAHMCLEEARHLALQLAREEKVRWGHKALDFALSKQRDQEGRVAPGQTSGLAAAADCIDLEVRSCLSKGASPKCEHIAEASRIADALRDEEFNQRRVQQMEQRRQKRSATLTGMSEA